MFLIPANLVINLYLMSGRSFGDDDIPRGLNHGHSIRVEKLSVTFPAFSKLKLETALFVENLAQRGKMGDEIWQMSI